MRGEQSVVGGVGRTLFQTGCQCFQSWPWFSQVLPHNFALREEHCNVCKVVLVHLYTSTANMICAVNNMVVSALS